MNSLSLSYLLAIAALAALSGGVSGAAMWLIGVWGVEKHQNRRLDELDSDMSSLNSRFTRFQKSLSGRLGAEEKEAKKTLVQEARDRLAQSQPQDDRSWVNGGH